MLFNPDLVKFCRRIGSDVIALSDTTTHDDLYHAYDVIRADLLAARLSGLMGNNLFEYWLDRATHAFELHSVSLYEDWGGCERESWYMV